VDNILSAIGSFFSWLLSWFVAEQANQSAANQAEQTAEAAHNADGSQSVTDQQSDDAQNASLNQVQQTLQGSTSNPATKS
jgi:hypothetical protein